MSLKFSDLINDFTLATKTNIVELAQTELSNENKKKVLDHKIIEFLDRALEKISVNFILKFALKKLLLPNVAIITQVIFDLLKTKIEGITK